MSSFVKDLRQGARMLVRQPGPALTAVFAFAVGIGLTTAMFSIVHGALAELPFEEAHRLIHLERSNLEAGIDSMEVPVHDLHDWRERQSSFEGLAAFYTGTANLSGPGNPPERHSAGFITANAFELLRVEPLLGRVFQSDEEGPAAPDVVVLGHGVWQSRYGGDPAIVGRQIRVNSRPHTVVGVMPEGFVFPFAEGLWLPLTVGPDDAARGQGITLEAFGRLEDGVSLDQAGLEFSGITAQLADDHPENEGIAAVLKPYTEEYVGEEPTRLLYTMLGAVFLVFLIACANVANLLLARTASRGKEMAVRSALGAGRLRVVRSLVTEVLALAGIGSLFGLALAWGGVRWFDRVIADTDPPFWLDFRVDGTALLFTIGLTFLAALLAGLIPALKVTGGGVHEVLKDESRGATGMRMGLLSKSLVVAEITLSCALLVGAGLAVKSVLQLAAFDFGYDPETIFTARIGLFEEDYPDAASRQRFFGQLEDELAALPGVETAAIGTGFPHNGNGGGRLTVEGETYDRPQDQPFVRQVIVTPSWFEAFEAPALTGRLLADGDRAGALPVAVVTQSFVAQFLPDGQALGRQIRVDQEDPDEPWRTVVGVVPDLYLDGLDDPEPEDQVGVLVPLAQSSERFMSLAVKLPPGAEPMSLTPLVRQAVAGLDPNLPIYWEQSLADVQRQNSWFYWIFGGLFMVFGAVALFLAAVGLYGVMAFSVSRRTHEVGIRMALGARAEQVLGLILRQGLRQIVVGLVLGLGLAFGLSRLLTVILYQVEPGDPLVFSGIAALLATVGLLACFLPARRAARVDPVVAMRAE